MRIAVDLDGVVYEWQRTWCYMLREFRGVDTPRPIDNWWLAWDSNKNFGTPEDHDWMWTEGVRLGLFRYGHMVKGARVGLQALHDAGHRLEVVTHRPEQAISDTLDWVSLYFKDIPLSGLTILSDGEPKSQSKADILIDDKLQNCEEWINSGRVAMVFSRPYNQGYMLDHPQLIRAHDWKDVVEELSWL